MPKVRRYDARLSVIVPRPLVNAVAAAVRESMTSTNAWIRNAVLAQLRLEKRREGSGDGAARA